MSDLMNVNFNDITGEMLKVISDYDAETGFKGAYNIREDSKCAGRQSSENITINPKTDKPGIDIIVKANTKGETVFIPACVTHAAVDDLVYNDFYIGEGADVVIVAGCGVHNDGEEDARHNGIHRFFLEPNARVVYKEKHIGTGKGKGLKKIDPVTECYLKENSYLEMDTVQLGGVDRSTRSTSAELCDNAKIVVRERIMTDNEEDAVTKFNVKLNGADSGADLVSRSVARGNSHQAFFSVVRETIAARDIRRVTQLLRKTEKLTRSPLLTPRTLTRNLFTRRQSGKLRASRF